MAEALADAVQAVTQIRFAERFLYVVQVALRDRGPAQGRKR
jgi:hypothetical protein